MTSDNKLKQEYIDSLIFLGYTTQEAEDQYNDELSVLSKMNIDDIPSFTILESEFDEF